MTEKENAMATAKTSTTTPKTLTLRDPFPAEAVGKLPRITCRACRESRNKRCPDHNWVRCQLCGQGHSSAAIHLDYVGHADVTDRLLKVDPSWTWRPFTLEEMQALPPAMRDAGLWVYLTVDGVTRPGFGDAQGKSGPNAVKECIGDALRNAAMRFGVALDLWAKGDRDWEVKDETPDPPAAQPAQEATQEPASAPPGPPADQSGFQTAGGSEKAAQDAFWGLWAQMTEAQQASAQAGWPFGDPPESLDHPTMVQAVKYLQEVRRTPQGAPDPS